jgi:hypothetical protein
MGTKLQTFAHRCCMRTRHGPLDLPQDKWSSVSFGSQHRLCNVGPTKIIMFGIRLAVGHISFLGHFQISPDTWTFQWQPPQSVPSHSSSREVLQRKNVKDEHHIVTFSHHLCSFQIPPATQMGMFLFNNPPNSINAKGIYPNRMT